MCDQCSKQIKLIQTSITALEVKNTLGSCLVFMFLIYFPRVDKLRLFHLSRHDVIKLAPPQKKLRYLVNSCICIFAGKVNEFGFVHTMRTKPFARTETKEAKMESLSSNMTKEISKACKTRDIWKELAMRPDGVK